MSINLKNILSHEIAFVFYVIFLYKITYYYLIGALFHFGWNFYLFDFDVEGFEGIYHNFSFFLASFNNLLVTIPLLIIYAFVYKFKDNFTWNEISTHQLFKPTKYFLIFVVAFTTWFYSFSAYNYYFDRLFLFDRLLLVFCFILLFRTPKILPLFILLTVLWVTQFSHPLGNNSITDKKIIYEMMIIFLSFISINSFKKINLNYLWVIIFALIGTNYFIPGIHKLIISPNFFEWITENQISNLVLNAYSRGWLSFLNESNFIIIIKFIEDYNLILTTGTIILELSALFILYKRNLAIVLLSSFVIFQIIIFLTAGVFFWKWILFNVFLTFLLLKFKVEFNNIFTVKNNILSIILIVSSPILFNPVWLGWWDIPINNTFKYYTKNNEDYYQIPSTDFKPYENIFTFSWQMKDLIKIKSNYLKLELDDYKILNESSKDINEIKNIIKNSYYNPKIDERIFNKFIKQYLNNRNKYVFLKYFHYSHIWTNKFPRNELKEDIINNLYVRHKMYYFYNYKRIRLIDTIVYIYE